MERVIAMSYVYTSDATEVAADLRRIADNLTQLEGVDLALLTVTLNIQVVRHSGTAAERRDSVDTLIQQILPGETPVAWESHHGTRSFPDSVGCVQVNIYTGLGEPS